MSAIGKRRAWLRRHRRGMALAAVALVVIAVAVGAVLSWHFSSLVLVPDHSAWPEDATVEALAPGRIVLAPSEGTRRPGVYGLDWQAGHAIVGEVLASDAAGITRRLCSQGGYIPAGLKVALDPGVYAGNPGESLGLPYSNVLVPGELGPMPAWLIPGQTIPGRAISGRTTLGQAISGQATLGQAIPGQAIPGQATTWAIVVHGINASPEDGLRLVPTLHRMGLPSLLITYREDLGAPNSPDGLHHMGLTEWRDLQAAARYALAHGAQRLVLEGSSMGGAIVAQFMERSPLARRVAGLVLDAPALSWKAVLSFNASEMGLPSFAALPVEWAIGARIDADWNSLDALQHPGDFHLPILLFHGMEDKTVPIATSDEFAKELPRWVTYYRVPRAGHVESWNVDPALYEQRLTAFLSRATGLPEVRSPAREPCGAA
jgi:pimeloyl-ACP methyl ester carboxylesterase